MTPIFSRLEGTNSYGNDCPCFVELPEGIPQSVAGQFRQLSRSDQELCDTDCSNYHKKHFSFKYLQFSDDSLQGNLGHLICFFSDCTAALLSS